MKCVNKMKCLFTTETKFSHGLGNFSINLKKLILVKILGNFILVLFITNKIYRIV